MTRPDLSQDSGRGCSLEQIDFSCDTLIECIDFLCMSRRKPGQLEVLSETPQLSTQLRIISKGSGGASFPYLGSDPGLLLATAGSQSNHTRRFTDPRPRERRIRFAYSIAGGIDTICLPFTTFRESEYLNFVGPNTSPAGGAFQNRDQDVNKTTTINNRRSESEWTQKVTDLTEKGNRAESSRLFLSLVMDKGSRARRAMWKSFVTLRTELPKLDRILRQIQERGPNPQEYMNIAHGLFELPTQLIDVQQKHKETLRAQTETLRVNTILMREKVKVFQLVDRYVELTVISTVRDRRMVEHELLARVRDHEEWREKHLCGKLEKIRTDQLFQNRFSWSKSKPGDSAAVTGVAGIGKTTMVQKIVYDWATEKIYQQFQFVFSFKFRDLNSINCRINLKELILYQYPYFGNILREVWKNPEGLLFIFDGLDEFNDKIDFADSEDQCLG
ncbi:uncharacterized protein [Hemitrygon akajei]|uniref:uncharacterized protein n=1 Tax=Hemitrygon akajei TaxID=2704970 RepID=UPI003BF9E375